MNTGRGCSYCGLASRSEKRKLPISEFVKRANETHNNKYDYSKVEYKNLHDEVEIVCPVHGVFKQEVNSHLRGYGCASRGCSRKTLNLEGFIERSNKTHNNKYDYSKVEYITNWIKVKILCPVHGEFDQIPRSHLEGHGCLFCNNSKGEELIQNFLMSKNISFRSEKKFKELGQKRFDFYLPELNTIIEYDGIHHFEPVEYWGGEDNLTKIKENDKIKNKFCKDNSINLLRIPYTEFINIEKILSEVCFG